MKKNDLKRQVYYNGEFINESEALVSIYDSALMFGDTISVSYGKAWDKYRYNDSGRGHVYQDDHSGGGVGDNDLEGPGEYEMIKYQGWSAAMNIGPLAIKGTKNNVDGAGEGGSNEARSHSELNMSLAF